MANIELLAEITASSMYIFDYFKKYSLELLIKTQTKSTLIITSYGMMGSFIKYHNVNIPNSNSLFTQKPKTAAYAEA